MGSIMSTEEEMRDTRRQQREFQRAWGASASLFEEIENEYDRLEKRNGRMFHHRETHQIRGVDDTYQAISSRLTLLRLVVCDDRKNVLKVTGHSMLFVPPKTVVLDTRHLKNKIINYFVEKYGGNTDRIEGKKSWGEEIWDWLQSFPSWSEEELITKTKLSLELWNKEEADYFAT